MILRTCLAILLLSACGCGLGLVEAPTGDLDSQPEHGKAAPEPQLVSAPEPEAEVPAVADVPEPPPLDVPPIEFLPGSEDLPTYRRDAISLVVEPVQEAVLPFQAVLVRVSLVNRTKGIVGPVDDLLRVEVNRKTEEGKPWRYAPQPPAGSAQWQRNGLQCFRLGPEQRLSIDIAFGHTIGSDYDMSTPDTQIEVTTIEPVFFAEPKPELEAHYRGVWLREEDDLRTLFSVRLAEPAGEDRACFELLEADPPLARVLYDLTVTVEPKQVPPLEKILATWPQSSYADYARFALARALLGGSGERLPQLKQRFALRTASDRDPNGRWAELEKRVSPFLPEAEWARVRQNLSSPSALPIRERFAAGIETQSHLTASLAERRKAVALIDGIRSPTYPYAAHALFLKHRVAEIDDPRQLPAIMATFQRDRPLAREWIRLLEETYETYSGNTGQPAEVVQAWANYRVRTSSRK